MKVIVGLFTIGFLTPLSASAAPVLRTPVRATSGSPTEAIEQLAATAKAGDADAFLDRLGGPARAAFERLRTEDVWEAALKARFGPDPDRDTRSLVRDKLDEFAARTYQVWAVKDSGDGRVDMTVWVTSRGAGGVDVIREETWVALREKAGWRLIPTDRGYLKEARRADASGRLVRVTVVGDGGPDAKASAREVAISTRLAGVYNRLAGEVGEGKYPDRQTATFAKREAALEGVEAALKPK